jgi:DNA-binding response OmpR family regulator
MMPQMSGHEVCQRIRELYPTATLPVIMISAKSNQENILEGFSAGCLDYVTKPFR